MRVSTLGASMRRHALGREAATWPARSSSTKTSIGEFRFRLTGEGYKTLAGLKGGVETVQRAAQGARAVDKTDEK